MSSKVHDDLIELANEHSPRIICGLLTGKKKGDIVYVEKFYPIPTRCGPKIHFKPKWEAYRFVKGVIHDNREGISYSSRRNGRT